MGIATGTAIGLVGAASAIGGAIAGGSDSQSVQTRNVAPATLRERELQERSFQQYLQQQALANQFESGINGQSQGVQDSARNSMQSILGGGAFNITPDEMAQIQSIRDQTVKAGSGDINRFVDQRLQQVQNSGAVRGLRGQALSQLQSGAINEGTNQLGNLVERANLTAAQQAQQAPLQRIQLQGGFAQQNMTFQDQLRQQAMANRQQLQNPVLMQNLYGERMGSAGTTTTTPGSFGGSVGGAFSGVGSVLGAAGDAKKAGLF